MAWEEAGTFELYQDPTDFEIVCPCCGQHDVGVHLDEDHVVRIVKHYFRSRYGIDFSRQNPNALPNKKQLFQSLRGKEGAQT